MHTAITTHAVCLLIVRDDGRILAISRPLDPSDFGLIGGGVEPEDLGADLPETLLNAIVREAQEEAGLRLEPARLRVVYTAKARTRISAAFVYDGDPGTPLLGDNAEGQVAWVTPAQILQGSFADYNRGLLAAVQ